MSCCTPPRVRGRQLKGYRAPRAGSGKGGQDGFSSRERLGYIHQFRQVCHSPAPPREKRGGAFDSIGDSPAGPAFGPLGGHPGGGQPSGSRCDRDSFDHHQWKKVIGKEGAKYRVTSVSDSTVTGTSEVAALARAIGTQCASSSAGPSSAHGRRVRTRWTTRIRSPSTPTDACRTRFLTWSIGRTRRRKPPRVATDRGPRRKASACACASRRPWSGDSENGASAGCRSERCSVNSNPTQA